MTSKLKDYAELVKWEHTVFALPFALASVVLLYEETPSFWSIFWILVAVISARTAGMVLNRYIDLPIDVQNPRTKNWVHASGRVGPHEIKRLIFLSSGAFVLSTLFVNLYAFLLSPVVLFLLWLYPYSKRFTYYPHLVLGAVYSLVPVGVDIALNTRVSIDALLLGIAMAFWVAGFDVLYALQDYDFDKEHGVKSIPVKYGIERSLKIAHLFHLITFLSLLWLGIRQMGLIYSAGLIAIAGFLVYEHSLIKPYDLSKINKAFFTTNGYISILFFIVVLLDKLLLRMGA